MGQNNEIIVHNRENVSYTVAWENFSRQNVKNFGKYFI